MNELERILRPFDRDTTSLPDRLVRLVPLPQWDIQNRHRVTTESWDAPKMPTPTLQAGYAAIINTDLNDLTMAQPVKDWIRTWFPLQYG